MALPKVLIVNQPFVNDTGGGITLSNLFSGWDSEKLAVACSGYIMSPDIDANICNNYYQLGHKERKWIFPLNLVTRKYYSGPVRLTDKTQDNIVVKKSKLRVKLIMNFLHPLTEYLGLSYFITKSGLSKELCNWIDEYNPDIVYAQCSTRESILLCIAIQNYVKKPFVYHMMDDWPSLIGEKGFLKNYWKRKIDREFRKLLDGVDLFLGISDLMAKEYKKRYGKEFKTFHNPINVGFWKSGQRTNYDLDRTPTILYAGRIGLGIDTSLKEIAKAVSNVNKDLDISMAFVIQSKEAPDWIKNFPDARHQGFSDYKNLPRVFGGADFLILPYDFSSESMSYIKYSMPTKASEYMASGTPIIIYASEDTALAQYAQQEKWAMVVTENKVDLLTEALKKLIQNKTVREEFTKVAKNLASERHADKIVVQNFRNELIGTLSKTKKNASENGAFKEE